VGVRPGQRQDKAGYTTPAPEVDRQPGDKGFHFGEGKAPDNLVDDRARAQETTAACLNQEPFEKGDIPGRD
jgi:hypothetical protein